MSIDKIADKILEQLVGLLLRGRQAELVRWSSMAPMGMTGATFARPVIHDYGAQVRLHTPVSGHPFIVTLIISSGDDCKFTRQFTLEQHPTDPNSQDHTLKSMVIGSIEEAMDMTQEMTR